mgnify:FL=1
MNDDLLLEALTHIRLLLLTPSVSHSRDFERREAARKFLDSWAERAEKARMATALEYLARGMWCLPAVSAEDRDNLQRRVVWEAKKGLGEY